MRAFLKNRVAALGDKKKKWNQNQTGKKTDDLSALDAGQMLADVNVLVPVQPCSVIRISPAFDKKSSLTVIVAWTMLLWALLWIAWVSNFHLMPSRLFSALSSVSNRFRASSEADIHEVNTLLAASSVSFLNLNMFEPLRILDRYRPGPTTTTEQEDWKIDALHHAQESARSTVIRVASESLPAPPPQIRPRTSSIFFFGCFNEPKNTSRKKRNHFKKIK